MNPYLDAIPPGQVKPSSQHVRGWTAISDTFVRNVERVGLIQPVIARIEQGNVRVLDGLRRARAAEKAGCEEIPALVYEFTDSEALQASLTANLRVWRKPVSEADEESALRASRGGPRKPVGKYKSDSRVFEAKYELGLVSETDRMYREFGSVDGIGKAIAVGLAERFDHPDAVHTASLEDLQAVPGVGPTIAQRLQTSFNESVEQH